MLRFHRPGLEHIFLGCTTQPSTPTWGPWPSTLSQSQDTARIPSLQPTAPPAQPLLTCLGGLVWGHGLALLCQVGGRSLAPQERALVGMWEQRPRQGKQLVQGHKAEW